MTEPRAGARRRHFLRFGEPRGRDIGVWVIIVVAWAVRVVTGDDQTTGWRLLVNIVLLAAGLAGLVVAATRLWRFHGRPSPDECAACGHYWTDHDGGAANVCAACTHEIEFGVPPRVAGGCRLTAPAST